MRCPGPRGSRTSPSRARATSSRRTGARSWPPSSPTSSTPRPPDQVRRACLHRGGAPAHAERRAGQRSAAMSSGDLHRVERGALAQVVVRQEQREAVLGPSGRRGCGRRRSGRCRRPQRRRDVGTARRRARSAAARRPRSGVIGRANAALIDSEWPVNTGTRTQVPDTAQLGDVEDLAALVAELLLLVGLVASRRRRATPANGSTLKAIGRGELAAAPGTSTARAVEGERRRRRRPTLRDLLVELGDAGQAGAGHGLVGADDEARRARPRRAAASSTGMAAMVVQFGLATMPLGRRSRACGLTSDTTSGTSGSIRHAEELSMTTAPAAATRGASARRGGAAGREQRDVEAGVVGGRRRPRRRSRRPATAACARPSGPRRTGAARRPGSRARPARAA